MSQLTGLLFFKKLKQTIQTQINIKLDKRQMEV